MNQTAYLDLQDIFINEVVGDIWLFVILGLILIWIFGLKAKIPMQPLLLLSIIWGGVCFSASFGTLLILWIFILLFVGTFFYFIIMRMLER